MADKKISELDALTGANTADDDRLVIVDTSAGLTKSITMAEFKNAFDSGSGFVRVTGDTMTGDLALSGADVTFGDSDKAIFGAGSDLQIYHDGLNSYIDDAGTGALRIRAQDLLLADSAGNPFISMIDLGTGGSVSLRHNTVEKLVTTSTGIDVTGEITADGLTVEDADGATIRIQSSDTSVDGGSLGQLEFYSNDASTGGTGVKGKIQVTDVSSYGTAYEMNFFTGYVTGGAHAETKKMSIGAYGDISFYEDTGTTPKFHWSAADESLGIGTSSPISDAKLTISDTTSPHIYFQRSSAGAGDAAIGMPSSAALAFYTPADQSSVSGLSEAMRISSSGLVGIGTSSPSYNLHVEDSSASVAVISGTSGNSTILLGDTADNNKGRIIYTNSIDTMKLLTNGSEAMRISSSGSVGIGTSSPSALLHVAGDARIGASTGDASLMGMVASGDNFKITTSSSVGTVSFDRNVGIGVVPSSWGDSTRRALQVNSGSIDSVSTSQILIRSNNYYDGSDSRYVNTAAAAAYQQLSGVHTWFTAASGTANNAITWDQAMTLDASGNLLVGKTSTSYAVEGITLRGDNSGIMSTTDGVQSLTLNRLTSDGTLILFAKDTSTVGSIGTYADKVYIGNGDTGLRFVNTSNQIRPFNTSTLADRDAGFSLGSSGARFTDLYLSGGVYLGGTGSANKLDDYEEGTWTPEYNDGQDFIVGATAVYRKVGNLVWVNFDVTGVSGRSSSTINNLPFTSSSTGGNFSGYTGYETLSTSSPIYSHMNANSSYVQLYVGSSSVNINAGERYIGAVVYSTD